MFRKLQDRVVAAASSALGMNTTTTTNDTAAGSFPSETVQRLQALGDYSREQVESALQTTNGNMDQAAELLFTQVPSHQHQQQHSMFSTATNNNTNHSTAGVFDEDMELQEALQQSLAVVQQPSPLGRTEIMNQAADAALRRAEQNSNRTNMTKKKITSKATSKATTATTTTSTTTSTHTTTPAKKQIEPVPPIRTKSQLLRHHHPDVQLIPKLQDKSTEEQILRTVDRMKHHPAAVDTLYRAMSLIYNNNNNNLDDHRKYRRIDTSTIGYQRSVATAPGTADFLRAMQFQKECSPNNNYHPNSPILILSDQMYDPALIYLGWSALEQIQRSPEYIVAKKQLVFQKDVTALIEATTNHNTNNNNNNSNNNPTKATITPEEQQQRNYYLSKCPPEPTAGRGALLQIHITDTYTIRRRFDSDDTIIDVLHWLAGTVGTTIYQRVLQKNYCLVDVNQVTRIPLDVTGPAQNYTLQYIGCWPSGRLQLQPNMDL